jgi:hypothetical protein
MTSTKLDNHLQCPCGAGSQPARGFQPRHAARPIVKDWLRQDTRRQILALPADAASPRVRSEVFLRSPQQGLAVMASAFHTRPRGAAIGAAS